MNEEEDQAAEEEVRRLLADARAAEPMPADVQARLDDVLAQMSSDRSAVVSDRSPGTEPPAAESVVVDLASRRRRRAKTLLVAAAAVTVLGLAAPRLLSGSDEMDAASDSAADTAAGGSAEERLDDSGSAGQEDKADAPAESAPESALDSAGATARPPEVRPDAFATDAESVRDQAARSDFTGFTPLDPTCLAGTELTSSAIRQLKSIPVRYGDLDAALVLRKPRNGSQEATLYVCGESSPRRSALLSAR